MPKKKKTDKQEEAALLELVSEEIANLYLSIFHKTWIPLKRENESNNKTGGVSDE